MLRVFRLLAFSTFALSANGSAAPVAPSAAKITNPSTTELVHIGNFTFNHPVLTVQRGTTVTWVNDDDIPHTVVAKNLAFRSKVLDTGERFSFTFAKAGQFDYFCSIHPHMTGKVIVKT